MKLSAVIVFAAQLLKAVRGTAEEEIVREDGVIVLEHGGNFSLCFAGKVYGDGLQGLFLRDRCEIVQSLPAEVPCNGLYRHCRTVLLALVGVSGNMGSGYVTGFNQERIHVGFPAPCVKDYCAEFWTGTEKGLLIHNLPSGGIDEKSAGFHQGEEGIVRHSACGGIQGDMHCDDVRLPEKFLQRHEALRTFRSGAGRVAP